MKNIAIITGASSGMGREFVKQLDNEGFDEIWAIALDKEGLETLRQEVKTKVLTFALDLTKEESFVVIRNMLDDEKPNVSWLCSCSGFGKFGRYDEICINQTENMIDLNCKAYVKLTEYVLPYMQNGARIVHIASVAGFQPVPYLTTYGATKAFTISYARGLNQELKPKGISVTCVCPFWTKTNFFKTAKDTKANKEVVSKYAVMYLPEKVIAKAIKDAKKRKEMSVYGFTAKFNQLLTKLLPHKFVMWVWKKQQKFNKKYKKA